MEETTTNDRLERWLALILGLLFFLPFVARADDLAYAGPFHGSEVRYASGERFFALTNGRLEPVHIRVKPIHDALADLPGESSGRIIEAGRFKDVYLLRSDRLQPGGVVAATPSSTELPVDAPLTINLGATQSTLDYHCGTAADADGFVECSLILATNGVTQTLGTVTTYFEARNDLQLYFPFAGDLDHDGRLDLLIDISADEHEWHPALFLSTAAAEGALVAKVAEFVTSGC